MADSPPEALPPLPVPPEPGGQEPPKAEAPPLDPLKQLAANKRMRLMFWVSAISACIGLAIAIVVIATGNAPTITMPH